MLTHSKETYLQLFGESLCFVFEFRQLGHDGSFSSVGRLIEMKNEIARERRRDGGRLIGNEKMTESTLSRFKIFHAMCDRHTFCVAVAPTSSSTPPTMHQ